MSREKPWPVHQFTAGRFPQSCLKCGMPPNHPNHGSAATQIAGGSARRATPPAAGGMEARPPGRMHRPHVPGQGPSTEPIDATITRKEPPNADEVQVSIVKETLHAQEATGNSCQECGGIMRRTGACETCESCGNNTGCG